MTTLQEALPCPFCGKQHTIQVISAQELMGEDQEFWQHSESFGVVCDASTPDGKGGCGAMGGFKPTEDEAIEAWNTRAALAQQGEQQPVAWYEYNQDLDAWFLAYGHNPKAKTRPLVFGDTAAPAAQAQPVAQPLTNSCHTCDHYQQGKRPGVSIHDDTCYGCSEYYANKWEAKSD